MSDDAGALEEAGRANAFGAINNLGGEDKVARSNFFAERADSTEGKDGADTEVFEGGNVGARGHCGRGNMMMFAVTSEEGDTNPRGEGTDTDVGRRVSPRLIGVGSGVG